VRRNGKENILGQKDQSLTFTCYIMRPEKGKRSGENWGGKDQGQDFCDVPTQERKKSTRKRHKDEASIEERDQRALKNEAQTPNKKKKRTASE